jgi:L-ascorbate metabolism protein UlaG (beta-lactamase superfamily)
VHAQQSPQFTVIRQLTNQEIALTLSAPTGINYRIDTGTNLMNWNPLVTFPTNTVNSLLYTDSATPFMSGRYYRAHDVTGNYVFSGDHLQTTNGDVIIHPLYHASLVLNWNGINIYSDPDDDPTYEPTYRGMPKADLILVTHSHGDHFSSTKIESLRTASTVIVCPQAVFSGLTANQRTNAVVLGHNTSTNTLGLNVEAVYAYNSNHSPLGIANGYVLTIGGQRIYISGDTGDAAELRALPNIDVAFLCMNIPFTMTVSQATNCVRGFQPRIVYPYHYRDQSGAMTNAARFKQLLGTDLGIEVRLRKWY